MLTDDPLRAPGATPLEPPSAIGGYHVERELGRGGMGVVYAARDRGSDALVALKVVHPWLLASQGKERVEACLDEACSLAEATGDPTLRVKTSLEAARYRTATGRHDAALRILDEAAAVAAESGDRRLEGAIAGTMLGRYPDARAHAETALDLAEELEDPRLIGRIRMVLGRLAAAAQVASLALLIQARTAALPGGDPQRVARRLASTAAGIERHVLMTCHFHLWAATGDREHIEQAYELLLELRNHAPERDREKMLAIVPLHRAIVQAAEAGATTTKEKT